MSEGESFWAGLTEKLIGLILIIASGLVIYFTATSLDTLGVYAGLFIFLSIVVLISGVFLLLSKTSE